MPAQVVTAVRRVAVSLGLVLQRGFQFNPRRVAVVAEAGLVTHRTDGFSLSRCGPMACAEVRCVDVAAVGNIFAAGIVAICADLG